MELKKVSKQIAIIGGVVVVTLFLINYLAGRNVPVASALAKKVTTG